VSKVPEWPVEVRENGEGFTVATGYRSGFKAWLKTMAGEKVFMVLRKATRKRSVSQNAFWWAVVVPMFAERCGYMPYEHDAVHDELMRVLVGLKEDSHPELKIRRSSTDLSTQEFNRLIEQAQIFAADKLGMVIPDPDVDWARRKARKVAA
jgi:hypothetical protein